MYILDPKIQRASIKKKESTTRKCVLNKKIFRHEWSFNLDTPYFNISLLVFLYKKPIFSFFIPPSIIWIHTRRYSSSFLLIQILDSKGR